MQRPLVILLLLVLSLPALARADAVTLRWQAATGARVVGSPTLQADRVYVGSDDHHLYAFDRANGTVVWRYDTGGAVACTPAVDDRHVYVTSRDGGLHAIDLATGARRWRFATGGERQQDVWDYYLSSPRVAGSVVYFGSGDGSVYALDSGTGQPRWSHRTGHIVHATPLLVDDVLYVGDFGGRLHALDRHTGSVRWVFKTVGDRHFPDGAIQGSARFADGAIVFGSRDYNVYAVDAVKGHGRWNDKEQSWIVSAPAVAEGLLVYGTSDTHEVIARDVASGAIRWRQPARLNVFADGTCLGPWVLFGGFDGRLRAFDLRTGELRWQFRTTASDTEAGRIFVSETELRPDFHQRYGRDAAALYDDILALGSILAAPAVEADEVYLTSTDGIVRALRVALP